MTGLLRTQAISIGHQGEEGVGSLPTGHVGAQVDGHQVAGEEKLHPLSALRQDEHVPTIAGTLIHPVAAEYRIVKLSKTLLHHGSIVAQWICLHGDAQEKAKVIDAIVQGLNVKYQDK